MERITNIENLKAGSKIGLEIKGKKILLINLGGDIFAYEDKCCHLGQKLSPGEMRDGVITCPIHEWQYDCRSGQGLNPPNVKLKSFPVQVRDGDIFVDVS